MKNDNHKKVKVQKCRIYLCLCLFVPLCLICFAGCGHQQKAAGNAISPETNEVSRTMQAAEDVLGKMHFEIEKADYNEGYIRTRPLAGAQFFEFWRTENIGAENQLLSNMHSIRRIVELNISNQNENLSTDCKVQIQRLSIPQREITSSARAYQMFTRSSISMQRLEMNPEQEKGMTWIDLDRDAKLEAEILKRINTIVDKKYKNTSSAQ
ncbi:MAG: hypothetical protein JW787_00040 [Sedimentisphaerales bacterium]|nr:hypothetical protein [Sedimentisphaerales bacterium]